MNTFQIKLLTPTAQMPNRGSGLAAGLDVRADLLDADGEPMRLRAGREKYIDVTSGDFPDGARWGFVLSPGKRALVPLGFAMSVSSDVYVRVAPRSGLALNDGLDVLAGVIDCDYRGTCGVVLHNTDDEDPILITQGMRVAQIVLERISLENPLQVTDLPDAGDRDAAGFGTTGTL
jgi:dUTP pyrophosphatase